MSQLRFTSPTTHRFVCVISKKIEVGRALNALGHTTAALVDMIQTQHDEMRFQDYTDSDGNQHLNISDNPFIVLKADNSNKLRTLRESLKQHGIVFTDFASTMIEGTFIDQHARTSQTPEADLEYYSVCFFAHDDVARELTRKFSLYI